MADQEKLLAVLVDADNTSPKCAKAIFDEIARLGEAAVRRVYGDFSAKSMAGWRKIQAEFGLVSHHQPANTVGKNASDIALVIDAMDLMHADRFAGFVLVSSDSDFTRLASRIREQGLEVYGIGKRSTPEAFRKACKRFIFLENIEGVPAPRRSGAGGAKASRPKAAAKSGSAARQVAVEQNAVEQDPGDLIRKAMEGIDQVDDWVRLSRIGQVITAANPEFDVRTYGMRKLSDLVESIDAVETRKDDGGHVWVRRSG